MQVRALLFDVFGTLVDWRSGVARGAQAVLEPLGYSLDWLGFADAWRGQYQPAMEEVRCGRIPYAKLDVLHRQTLQKILPRFSIGPLKGDHLDRLTLAWHQLDGWPDVEAGLSRLRQRFLIAPVSNGNIALMCDLARRNDFRWDAILGADLVKDFKPKAAVYRGAADAFSLNPAECMMCAAHGGDLKAAAENGLRTAFIARPAEGPDGESTPSLPVDVTCRTLGELADHFDVQ
ncbi:MAG TPA: haloacid dehalogenase type II [Steroidobacteraceae bacterium]